MKKLDQDIKNKKFENIYLLCGEESFLLKTYKDRLVDAITDGDMMNVGKYEGNKIDIKSLIDDLSMAPFFADYRVIIVDNGKLFKKANDELADALLAIPETTVLICVERDVTKEGKPDIDKRNRVYKAADKRGYVCEMKYLSNNDLFKWAARKINHEEKKITAKTLEYLLSLTDGSMYMVKNEIEKVLSYVGEREVIEIEDVDAVCSKPIVGKIFEMTDAISKKNKEQALNLYNDLIASKEAPSQILYMLSRQFFLLLAVKELDEKGASFNEIASKLRQNPYAIKMFLKQCGNFDKKTIMKAFRDSIRVSKRSRSGLIDEKIGVEMFLMKYSE